MKRSFFMLILCVSALIGFTQQPPKISTKAARDVLDLLPGTLTGMNAVKEKDRVLDAKGKQGVIARRQYGNTNQPVYFHFINQSMSLATITSTIASVEGKATPGKEVANIRGYKALLERTQGEDGTNSFQVIIPIRDNLLVLQGRAYSKADMIGMATSLPLAAIDQKLR